MTRLRRCWGCLLAGLPGVACALDTDPASLSRLHDIVLPPPAPLWPPAPGWYWLGGVLFLVTVLTIASVLRRFIANRYRRAALRESVEIPGVHWPPATASALLKRTAMIGWGRGQVAGLSGQAWVEWLNNHCKPPGFEGESARLIADSPYNERQEISKTQLDGLLRTVRHWIRHHRVRRQ